MHVRKQMFKTQNSKVHLGRAMEY